MGLSCWPPSLSVIPLALLSTENGSSAYVMCVHTTISNIFLLNKIGKEHVDHERCQ